MEALVVNHADYIGMQNGRQIVGLHNHFESDDFTDNIFGKLKERKEEKKKAIAVAKSQGFSKRTAKAMGRQAVIETKIAQKEESGKNVSNRLSNMAVKAEARGAQRAAIERAKSEGVSKRTAKAAGKAAKSEVLSAGLKTTKGGALQNIARVALAPVTGGLSLLVPKGVTEKGIDKEKVKAVEQKAYTELVKSGHAPGSKTRKKARDLGQEVAADIAESKGKTKKAKRLRERDGKTGLQVGAEKVITAPLLPFKNKMKSILKSKGVNPPSKMVDLANVFYKEVVQKAGDAYERRAVIDLDDYDRDHVVGTLLPVVVDAVIDFFKMAKDKKDSGGELSRVEEKAAEATEIVEAELDEKMKQEAAETVGENLLYNPKVQLLIGGILLFILLKAFKVIK